MGSRSKFHKSKAASTPGRALLHGPRPKKPLVVRFTDALEDAIRERRQAKASGGGSGTLTVEGVAPPAKRAPRKTLRAATRALARSMFRTANASVPRAERRRTALAEAREQMAPKKEVRA